MKSSLSSPKLLILAIDALTPEIVFNNLDYFPNIKKMCSNGTWGEYDAYCLGYGSFDNWISIYTGLTPAQHGTKDNYYKDTNEYTTSDKYSKLQPFWEMCNNKNLSVGLWRALCTTPPYDINGFMVSCEPNNNNIENRKSPFLQMQFSPGSNELKKLFKTDFPLPKLPLRPEDFGYKWDDLFENTHIADKVITDDYFKEGVEYFKEGLNYFSEKLIQGQKIKPVDILYFFTSELDLLQHFQVHEKNKSQIIRAIKALDSFVQLLIEKLSPENIILLSDHGIQSFKSFFGDSPVNIQQEAFGLRNSSLWLSNGEIITKARNGAPLMGVHSLKATFIGCGPLFKKTQIKDMRTLDIYPTLLEMFDIKIPPNRSGFVQDFLNKDILNKDKLITNQIIEHKEVLFLQTTQVYHCEKIINEVFLDNRFKKITVVGEKKYKECFLANKRVESFITFEDFAKNSKKYEKVFIPYINNSAGTSTYLEFDSIN